MSSARNSLCRGQFLRRAHASEIFRAAFYDAKKDGFSVSPLDLDYLISSERVRPSILIPPLEIAGSLFGMAARISPFSSVKEQLTEAVDSATVQQFNDVSY